MALADTALNLWSGMPGQLRCYEHFAISSGRGSGWHHFSGLSSPVLAWHGACCAPGRLTGGFDVLIVSRSGNQAELRIDGIPGSVTTLMAVTEAVNAVYNGRPCPVRRRRPGLLEIDLPKATSGTLVLS